ncbi:hypothetical protein AQUCO_03400342v1, partial [Aquilegia coerulea]
KTNTTTITTQTTSNESNNNPKPVQHQQQYSFDQVPPLAPVPSFPAFYPTPMHMAGQYSVSQFQQAQFLFEKDKQTITSEAIKTVQAALASNEGEKKTEKKVVYRKAAGQAWADPTLAEWPQDDYRLFCGNLGSLATDTGLSDYFSTFPSFNMARVVRDKRTGKTKGYGFVSFSNASDCAAALKVVNGKPVCGRPVTLRKSTWKERIDHEASDRQKIHSRKKQGQPKKGVLHK